MPDVRAASLSPEDKAEWLRLRRAVADIQRDYANRMVDAARAITTFDRELLTRYGNTGPSGGTDG